MKTKKTVKVLILSDKKIKSKKIAKKIALSAINKMIETDCLSFLKSLQFS